MAELSSARFHTDTFIETAEEVPSDEAISQPLIGACVSLQASSERSQAEFRRWQASGCVAASIGLSSDIGGSGFGGSDTSSRESLPTLDVCLDWAPPRCVL